MEQRQTLLGALAVCGLIAFIPAARAQKYPSSAQTTQAGGAVGARTSMNKMGSSDATFATKAAQGGMAEVELGQLAKNKASSQAVKDFGQKMIDDHSKANEELKSLAANNGMTLPGSLDSKDQATYNKLSNLSGAEFDKAYMRDMVSDHRTDVSEFQREANHGSDPDMKAFAAKTLPVLEQHLQLAESTESQVKSEK